MAYYDLKNHNTITVVELLEKFSEKKTITEGCISIFEDSIGKPGDRFSQLTALTYSAEKLRFSFGKKETITISYPKGIVINEKVIGVQECKQIEWY